MGQVVLEMKGIEKSFGTVRVLKGVDFSVHKGEIHALVGGNGAGKSTLMKIMTGVYTLDSGEIFVDGKKVTILNSQDAKLNGIAMIFQELSLVQSMTVTENIFLGEEIKKGILRDTAAMRKKAVELLDNLGINIDPDIPVSKLSVGMSQMVEIAKAISKNAKILVLDEPTASLSESETAQLFRIMNELKKKGVSMIYISHRMNEILAMSDSITILRDGSLITTDKTEHMDLTKIINHLSGGETVENKFNWVERDYDVNGEDLLTVEHLKISDKINDVSFSLKKGEIIGFAGLMGSGRTEILETIFGIRKSLDGNIKLCGKEVKNNSSKDAVKAGFALIPEDRRKKGLVLNHSIKDNAILPVITKVLKKNSFIIDDKAVDNMVNDNVRQLNVVTNNINKQIKLLSGGNQQKVVIAKWLNSKPIVMMLDEPTAGVDISAKTEIMEIIRRFADEGNGVIFVSSELTEMMAVCDRIIILYDGKITGEVTRKDIKSEEELQHAVQKK